jgi:hypothetical protein
MRRASILVHDYRIRAWFDQLNDGGRQYRANKLYDALFENASVICYEAPDHLDATTLPSETSSPTWSRSPTDAQRAAFKPCSTLGSGHRSTCHPPTWLNCRTTATTRSAAACFC